MSTITGCYYTATLSLSDCALHNESLIDFGILNLSIIYSFEPIQIMNTKSPIFHPRFSEIVLTGSLQHKGIDILYLGKDKKTKSHNIHDLGKVKGVHTFGAFHPKVDDYLFGITYEKMVYYVRVPGEDMEVM